MRALFLFLLSVSLLSCNQQANADKTNSTPDKTTPEYSETETPTAPIAVYPKSIAPVFQAHGGIAKWNAMHNLCFEIEKESGTEKHSTDLKSRKTRIEHQDWTIGFDGAEVWLDQENEAYKGNARFYHNLYFYFYAMPFIVSDPGVNYLELEESLVVDGKSYRGTLISYNDGVGDSPKDEYKVYRDPETGQMAWLGYTVTYRDGEKKDSFNFIKYDSWQEVNGLMLPKELIWYAVEDGQPTEPRGAGVVFSKVSITETLLDDSLFAKPEGAIVVPR